MSVAAAIAFYQFATWAAYAETPRDGAKFRLAPRPLRMAKRGTVPPAKSSPGATRASRAGAGAAADGGEVDVAALFGDG